LDFIIIEVVFKYERTISRFPAVANKGLFCLLSCLDTSDKVITYKVIDRVPVLPKHFGWGQFNKWVVKFENEVWI
jgi:hypothetical protein